MTAIITGGRHNTNRLYHYHILNVLHDQFDFDLIKHGDCPTGTDAIADEWAEHKGIEKEMYPADWSKGKAAGPLRNRYMAQSGADICIAFPGGRGTANMKKEAAAAGIQVMTFEEA